MSPVPSALRSRTSVAARASIAASASLLLVLLVGLIGCGFATAPPAPTPADFQGIAAELVQRGVQIEHIVSGDAGCDDITLERTAIGLDAFGLDQDTPTRLFIHIFRNRASFERLRDTIGACALSYVTDPDAFESIEESPFVVASAGPWAPEFRSAVRAAIKEAAGTGD
jgi:hypothetical protein